MSSIYFVDYGSLVNVVFIAGSNLHYYVLATIGLSRLWHHAVDVARNAASVMAYCVRGEYRQAMKKVILLH